MTIVQLRSRSLASALGIAVIALAANAATAADLPPAPVPFAAPHIGFVAHPYFAEASRFDIYGYPVVPAVPNPLYASTGCPPLLQPVYDAMGNFAGYGPVQGCR